MRIETAAQEKPVAERAHRSDDDLDRDFWPDAALIPLPFENVDKACRPTQVDRAHCVSDKRVPAGLRADLNVKADFLDCLVTAIMLRHATKRGQEVACRGYLRQLLAKAFFFPLA